MKELIKYFLRLALTIAYMYVIVTPIDVPRDTHFHYLIMVTSHPIWLQEIILHSRTEIILHSTLGCRIPIWFRNLVCPILSITPTKPSRN
jgi:hypothetical protein